MSNANLAWAFRTEINPGSKLVLIALADMATPEGLCWPNPRALETWASMSESEVQAALTELELADLLAIDQRGDGGFTRYRLRPGKAG